MEITDSLRRKIKRRLGRTSSSMVLDECIKAFALFGQPVPEYPIDSSEHYLGQEHIIQGAEIAHAMMRISSKTYEGRVITTGIFVTQDYECQAIMRDKGEREEDLRHITFTPPVSINWRKPEALLPYAQLADGKHSVLLCDINGILYGIVNADNEAIIRCAFKHTGYVMFCTKNREVVLYNPWRHLEDSVAAYDGFEWSDRADSMSVLKQWLDEQALKAGKFEWRHTNAGAIEPATKYCPLKQSLIAVIDQISQLRLSTIIVLCKYDAFLLLREKRILSSLRQELDSVTWHKGRDFGLSYVPLFRLDGAHFISIEYNLFAVSQRIFTDNDKSKSLAGTGRSAARHLSKCLGTAGIVVKVSSDGPVSVYLNGEQPRKYISSLDAFSLTTDTGKKASQHL